MKNKKWNSDNIGNQKGRVAVVTGSSSGIGYETARVLSEKDAEVIIAVRNMQKGESAADKIRSGYSGANVKVMKIDLSSLSSVKDFAESFKKGYDRLDLLINNAGVMMPPYSKTEDGFELQMGTNHLGHFALTGHLLELIERTPDSRIVNVSSAAHNYGNIDFDDLNWEQRKYNAMRAYADSKIANIYFTNEMSQKLNGTISAAAHPGWTATDLQRHSGIFSFLNNFLAQDISMGALPTLYAAVGEDVKSGDYFGPSGFREMRGYPKRVESNGLSHDVEIAGKLWDVSQELTGVTYKFKS